MSNPYQRSYLQISISDWPDPVPGRELGQIINYVVSIETGLRVGNSFVPIRLSGAAIQAATTFAQLTAAINAELDDTEFGAALRATLLSDGFTIAISDAMGREFADEWSEMPLVGVTWNQRANTMATTRFEAVQPTSLPDYSVRALSGTLNEGSTATFELSTANIYPGSPFSYTLSGVSAADITGGVLSGTAKTLANGKVQITVPIARDNLTEGTETLTLTIEGESASVTIRDTSTTQAPTYTLGVDRSSVDEGSTAIFTIGSTGVAAGSLVPYTLSGISAADVLGGSLVGNAVIDSNGRTSVSITLAADHLTEGPEVLTFTMPDWWVSVLVNDTSRDLPEVVGQTVGETVVFAPTDQAERITGRSEMDIVQYATPMGFFQAWREGGDDWQLEAVLAPANIDQLSGIERLRFTDTMVALDLDGNAGGAVRVLASLLGTSAISNRPLAGVAIGLLDSGMSEPDLARLALTALGVSTVQQLTSTLWKNLTGLDAGASEFALVQNLVASGMTFEDIVLLAAGTDVMTATLGASSLLDHGIAYTPYVPPPPPLPPTYAVTASGAAVNEGGTATFNVVTGNLAPGTAVDYALTGVTAADIADGRLTGQVVVDGNGKATLQVPIAADHLSEGLETLVVNLAGASASMRIDDTSLTPVVPGYSLAATSAAVDEGSGARFVLTTQNVAAGTVLNYHISGSHIDAADLFGGLLGGQVVVDQAGRGVIDIGIRADEHTEGSETLQIAIETVSASLLINDTSTTLIGVPPDPGGDGGGGDGGGGGGGG